MHTLMYVLVYRPRVGIGSNRGFTPGSTGDLLAILLSLKPYSETHLPAYVCGQISQLTGTSWQQEVSQAGRAGE